MRSPLRIAGLPAALLLALALGTGCGKEPEAPTVDPLLLEKNVEVVRDVVQLLQVRHAFIRKVLGLLTVQLLQHLAKVCFILFRLLPS